MAAKSGLDTCIHLYSWHDNEKFGGFASVSTQTTILIAEDHPLFRDALVSAIQGLGETIQINVSGTFEQSMNNLSGSGDTDLVLLDLFFAH